MITKVKFLIEKPEGELPCNVFAFFPEELHTHSHPDLFTCYAHIGQHSACTLSYANECKEANYNEYQDLLKELIQIGYKLDILNSQVIECHRKPTEGEIKFGEGATHYRDFTIQQIGINSKGELKIRFKADDSLTYSR